ncbi:MAG: AraC family transcriptional regulator [bacterium]
MIDTAIPLATGEYLGRVVRREVVAGAVLADTQYLPHATLALHQHQTVSFFLIAGATFNARCGSAHDQLSPGSATMHLPGAVHGGTFGGSAPSGFNVELTPEWTKRWDVDVGSLGPSTTFNPSDSGLPRVLGRLRREHRAQDFARELAIQGLLAELVVLLTRVQHPTTPGRARLGLEVARAVEILRADSPLPEWFDVARLVGVPPAELSRAFRVHVGCAPAAYLRRARLDAAARALTTTSEPLARVALNAGYYDQAHFSRAFRAAFAMTPSAYRKACRDA